MTKHYINDLIFICEDNLHVRAYLIRLINVGILPSHIIYVKNKIPAYGTIDRFKYRIKDHWPLLRKLFIFLSTWVFWFNIDLAWYNKLKELICVNAYSKEDRKYSKKIFGRDITHTTTLELLNEANIPFEIIYTNNINDPSLINKLEKLSCRYVVTSHGSILTEKIFNTNKSFINVHKGILPFFRGSSPTHWAMLINKQLYGATIHFMDKGIDTGPIIRQKTFEPPLVDTFSQIGLYEAHIVSNVLVEVIVDLHANRALNAVAQDTLTGTTFYRMHPLLGEISKSRQLRNRDSDKSDKCEIDHKNWIEKLKNNFKIYFYDSNVEFTSDVGWHEVLRKSLNDENIKDIILKERFVNLLSILESGCNFNEQDISFFNKQINLGWDQLKGIKQSSIVYLLSDMSIILLNTFLIILYQKSRDLRLLNTSFKLNGVMKSIRTDSLCVNAYRLMFRVMKEQRNHLNDLREYSISKMP